MRRKRIGRGCCGIRSGLESLNVPAEGGGVDAEIAKKSSSIETLREKGGDKMDAKRGGQVLRLSSQGSVKLTLRLIEESKATPAFQACDPDPIARNGTEQVRVELRVRSRRLISM